MCNNQKLGPYDERNIERNFYITSLLAMEELNIKDTFAPKSTERMLNCVSGGILSELFVMNHFNRAMLLLRASTMNSLSETV